MSTCELGQKLHSEVPRFGFYSLLPPPLTYFLYTSAFWVASSPSFFVFIFSKTPYLGNLRGSATLMQALGSNYRCLIWAQRAVGEAGCAFRTELRGVKHRFVPGSKSFN